MIDSLRRFATFPLLALAAAAVIHCSSDPATAGASDASAPDASTPDASTPDAQADVSSVVDASAPDSDVEDAGTDAPLQDAADAAPPCVVRTSGDDAGALDPTFSPFTWSAPAPYSVSTGYPPKFAVAPGGDSFVALALQNLAIPSNEAQEVVLLHVLASGALDPKFGGSGAVTIASWTRLYDLIVDHNGDAVVTGVQGASGPTTNGFTLLAYRPDGTRDFAVSSVVSIEGGTPSYCAGCIADGQDGYLTVTSTNILNIASNGTVTPTDTISFAPVNQCSMVRGKSTVSVACDNQGGIARFDLHGVRVATFGSGGVQGTFWDPLYGMAPAADDSLYMSFGTRLDHILDNGAFDPAFPASNVAPFGDVTAQSVLFGGPRCDGEEVFLESTDGQNLALQLISASSPTLIDAGTAALPEPDGGTLAPTLFGMDAHGAVLALSLSGVNGIEIVRLLPSL